LPAPKSSLCRLQYLPFAASKTFFLKPSGLLLNTRRLLPASCHFPAGGLTFIIVFAYDKAIFKVFYFGMLQAYDVTRTGDTPESNRKNPGAPDNTYTDHERS
jgi:hypothetical protein